MLALGPSSALAFETVDTMIWPSSGVFPAYPADELRPWGLRAYAGGMWDDNVTRVQNNPRSDFVSRFGVGADYAARVYGRQSVRLDAYGEWRDYQKLDLDHFAYGTTAEWLWELTNSFAGTVGWRRVHRLADLSESVLTRKTMITEDRYDATGAYFISPEFRLTGGIGSVKADRDNALVETTDAWAARGGIQYVSGLGNTVGVELRYGEGDAPVDDPLLGTFPDNRYTRRDAALTAAFGVTPDIRVRGRLGHTEREYTDFPGSNFSGATGRAGVDWRPGAKTLLVLEGYREVEPVIDANALHADRRGAVVGITWAATVKLVFGARFLQERRIYVGDVLAQASGIPLRDETVRVWRLSAGWEPERHWQFSGALDFGDRDSNILNQSYQYTAVTVNLRYEFR